MTMEGTGIVPVMDMNRNNGYGDGCGWGMGGMWFMWIIVIFALMGGWGNNWNNRGNGAEAAAIFANGSMTRDQVSDGFSMQEIKNGIRGVQNGLCDGFYAQNTTMLQGFNGIQRDLCQGFGVVGNAITTTGYQLGSQISENRFAAQQCCCETNRNIDAVRAENYRNTCDITTAIHQEGEATRALINANTMQDLRDKLADRDRDIQSRDFQLSQLAQNSTLINALRPFPQPAYITCSPYESARGVYGCGSGCNC